MADEKDKRQPQGDACVDNHEPREIELWARRWCADHPELEAAEHKAGVASAAKAQELGKAPEAG